MSQAVSTHVDTLADQMLTQYHQQQQRTQQREQVETSKKDQQEIAVLQALIATELEPELLAALAFSYEIVRREHNDPPQAVAVLHYTGVVWHLLREFTGRNIEWRWTIRASGQSYDTVHKLSTNAAPLQLRTTLLLKFGERREQIRLAEQEAVIQAMNEQKRADAAQARKDREAPEEAKRIALADEEDARLREQHNTLRQETLAQLWRWPAGVQIAIYRLDYCAGIGQGEDGTAVIDRESGWTALDHLDADGYIRLEPTCSYHSESSPREIKLAPIHMPTWRRLVVASVEELPKELRRDIVISLPGVVCRNNLDGRPRLTRIEGWVDEDSLFTEHIGRIPLSWIQALVDQAKEAQGEA